MYRLLGNLRKKDSGYIIIKFNKNEDINQFQSGKIRFRNS